MLRGLSGLDQDLLESVMLLIWRPLLYTMCFLHAVVQERCRYGSLGWSLAYEFSAADLGTSLSFLQRYLAELDPKTGVLEPSSWAAIRYMVCEVLYGGRVTDEFDRLLMTTYGEVWLDTKVQEMGFEFCPGYTVPDMRLVTEYVRHVEGLPVQHTPEVRAVAV